MISPKYKGGISIIIYEPWCGPFVVQILRSFVVLASGGGLCLRRGGGRVRKGKFQLPLTIVSSSHACTRRTSHRILSDFGLGRLVKYSLFLYLPFSCPAFFDSFCNTLTFILAMHRILFGDPGPPEDGGR